MGNPLRGPRASSFSTIGRCMSTRSSTVPHRHASTIRPGCGGTIPQLGGTSLLSGGWFPGADPGLSVMSAPIHATERSGMPALPALLPSRSQRDAARTARRGASLSRHQLTGAQRSRGPARSIDRARSEAAVRRKRLSKATVTDHTPCRASEVGARLGATGGHPRPVTHRVLLRERAFRYLARMVGGIEALVRPGGPDIALVAVLEPHHGAPSAQLPERVPGHRGAGDPPVVRPRPGVRPRRALVDEDDLNGASALVRARGVDREHRTIGLARPTGADRWAI